MPSAPSMDKHKVEQLPLSHSDKLTIPPKTTIVAKAGYNRTEDVNGYMQEGVGLFDMTTHEGLRWSAASAYLRPALKRPQKNLSVESKVLVSKILFEGKKAVGIEYTQKGQTKRAYADNEVIVRSGHFTHFLPFFKKNLWFAWRANQ